MTDCHCNDPAWEGDVCPADGRQLVNDTLAEGDLDQGARVGDGRQLERQLEVGAVDLDVGLDVHDVVSLDVHGNIDVEHGGQREVQHFVSNQQQRKVCNSMRPVRPVNDPPLGPWFWICPTCKAQVKEGDTHACPGPPREDDDDKRKK